MSDYKATPEHWEIVEFRAQRPGFSCDSCILELSSRLTAAEQRISELQAAASTPDHIRGATEMVATDQELRDEFYAEQREDDARRAIYNLGRQHGAAQAKCPLCDMGIVEEADLSPTSSDRHIHSCSVTLRPLRYPSPATIAECGGPCEEGFHLCDCGELEKLNPELRGPAPAGGLVELVADQLHVEAGFRDTSPDGSWDVEARAAILACAMWLEERGLPTAAHLLKGEVERG